MPKNKTTKTMSYDERYERFVVENQCPYCDSKDVSINEKAKRGGVHCTCNRCGAENYFSRNGEMKA